MVAPFLEKLREGDAEEAWTLFVDCYRRLIFAVIRRYATEADEMMDLFAHICGQLREHDLARLRRYRHDSVRRAAFSTWLVVVLRNLIVDWYRQRDGRPRRSPPAGLTPLGLAIYQRVFVEGRAHADTYELIRQHSDPLLIHGDFLRELRVVHRVVFSGPAGGAALATSGATTAIQVWRESLRLARSTGDSTGEAAALGNLGVGFYRDGALDSAERYLARSRLLGERTRDYRTLGNAVGTLASIAKDRDQLVRAKALYLQALAIRDRTGDDRGAAADENNLGLIAETLGDTAGARREYESALIRNRRGGRLNIAAVNLTNLANLATVAGDYMRATGWYHEALAIRRGAGERAGIAPVLRNLGLLEQRRGDFVAARDALTEAVAIFEVTGPPADAIGARADLAETESAMGDLQSALTHLRQADSIAVRASLPAVSASLTLARADLALDFNAYAEAERDYTIAAEMFGQLHDLSARANAIQGMGLLQLHRHDAVAARKTFDDVLRVRAVSGDPRATASTRLLVGYALAGLELEAGHSALAKSMYERAIARVGAHAAAAVSADLHVGHARALTALGAYGAAASELRLVIGAAERVAGSIRLTALRAGYRADKWDIYMQLAMLERRRGDAAAAFQVSERLRGREMLDLLAEGRVAARARPGDSAIAREQDLRRRITALEQALEDEGGQHNMRGLPIRADRRWRHARQPGPGPTRVRRNPRASPRECRRLRTTRPARHCRLAGRHHPPSVGRSHSGIPRVGFHDIGVCGAPGSSPGDRSWPRAPRSGVSDRRYPRSDRTPGKRFGQWYVAGAVATPASVAYPTA